MITRELEYFVDGDRFVAYYAAPENADSSCPGVIVVHEWWGHNDYVRQRADQLAGDGCAALAIDLYGDGKQADNPEQAGAMMNAAVAQPGAIANRFDAAMALLRDQPEVESSNINAIGYCFGGAVVLNMARAGKGLRTVAGFHGLLETDSPMQAGVFDGKILVFNGADDPMVSPEILAAFEAEMAAANVDCSVTSYPGVVHGFTNPAATERGKKYGMPLAHDAVADNDSYTQMLAQVKRNG